MVIVVLITGPVFTLTGQIIKGQLDLILGYAGFTERASVTLACLPKTTIEQVFGLIFVETEQMVRAVIDESEHGPAVIFEAVAVVIVHFFRAR
jgi:hypothetical protein